MVCVPEGGARALSRQGARCFETRRVDGSISRPRPLISQIRLTPTDEVTRTLVLKLLHRLPQLRQMVKNDETNQTSVSHLGMPARRFVPSTYLIFIAGTEIRGQFHVTSLAIKSPRLRVVLRHPCARARGLKIDRQVDSLDNVPHLAESRVLTWLASNSR